MSKRGRLSLRPTAQMPVARKATTMAPTATTMSTGSIMECDDSLIRTSHIDLDQPGEPGDDACVGGRSMTTPGAMFEIKVDGVVRSYRDVRDTAIEAARFLQQRNPNAKITVTDLRDGASVTFERGS